MDVPIRRASYEEVKAIKAVASMSEFTKDIIGQPSFINKKNFADGNVLVATIDDEDGEAIVGYAIIDPRKRKSETHIKILGVNPRYFGLGRLILDFIISDQESAFLSATVSKQNENSLKFHQSYGFKIIGEARNATAWYLHCSTGRGKGSLF